MSKFNNKIIDNLKEAKLKLDYIDGLLNASKENPKLLIDTKRFLGYIKETDLIINVAIAQISDIKIDMQSIKQKL